MTTASDMDRASSLMEHAVPIIRANSEALQIWADSQAHIADLIARGSRRVYVEEHEQAKAGRAMAAALRRTEQ